MRIAQVINLSLTNNSLEYFYIHNLALICSEKSIWR